MNDSEFQQLWEASLRRPLHPEEESKIREFLESDPESLNRWQTDAALTRLLASLPDPPMSGNFTSRVLQAIDREAPARRPASFQLPAWLPLRRPAFGLAVALALAGIAGLWHHRQQTVARASLADSVVRVASGFLTASAATEMPTIELWQDFEPIYRLTPSVQGPDEELLAALQ